MPDWLHVLLRREGYLMNHKKLFRLHRAVSCGANLHYTAEPLIPYGRD